MGQGDFPPLTKDPSTAYQLGQLPGTWPQNKGHFGHWNQRDKDEARPSPSDYGWIGEDDMGVWIRRDPQIALLDFPGLWPVVASWEAGQREMTPGDYDQLSAYHYSAKLNLAVAKAREDTRARSNPTH